MTESASQRERLRAQQLHRMQWKEEAELAMLVTAIMEEPAELELPIEVAFLSGLVSSEQQSADGEEVLLSSRAVVKFDRQGVKSTLIESSRSQSNVVVTDEDLRKSPKLVAAAALA